ncbi:uncharacterized protein LOC136040582 isoform X2 [Artemia franciscana]|uniref:Uncharacterized protein n=1 Tax=Artemia franciscana TaxID=6661 RepID=A0AA88HX50_ARTSF|nr:hypothetical protein QYM36_010383 [Artemia franciscana]
MPVADRIVYNEEECIPPPFVPVHQLLFDKLTENLDEVGDIEWLVNGVTGESIKYGEIIPSVDKLSSYLKRKGFRTGDILMMYCANHRYFFLPLFAAWRCGGGATFTSPGLLPSSVIDQALDSKTKFIFVDNSTAEKAKKVMQEVDTVVEIITFESEIKNCTSFSDILENKMEGNNKVDKVEIDVDNVIAYLPYSSGTTGLPKGIVHTHRSVWAMLQIFRRSDIGTSYATGCQMFHMSGFFIGTSSLLTFNRNVFLQNYEEEAFIKMLEKYQPTFLFSLPPPLIMMLKHPNLESYNLKSIEIIITGGACMTAESQRALMKRLPALHDVRCLYGMTEIGGVTSFGLGYDLNPNLANVREKHRGSVGRPNPGNEIKVINEQGIALGPYEKGEICVRNLSSMKEYLHNPEATRNTKIDGGWIKTGDIGYYTEDGFIYWTERKKELLKYRGYHVVPAKLESMLLQHPAIKDAGIIGVPDEEVGELVGAAVVLKDGAKIDPNDIISYMNSSLSEYEQLRAGVKVFKNLPYNDVGKLVRKQLLRHWTEGS